jgi:hypothetical protein
MEQLSLRLRHPLTHQPLRLSNLRGRHLARRPSVPPSRLPLTRQPLRLGNVDEWVEECSHIDYNGAPADGAAWNGGDCTTDRVVRGGSWNVNPGNLRSALLTP